MSHARNSNDRLNHEHFFGDAYPFSSNFSKSGLASYEGGGGKNANRFPRTPVMQQTPGGQHIVANIFKQPW